jgi:hypothetical protein
VTKSEKKKLFRIEGVNYTKNLGADARKIETFMNDMVEDGYRVQINEEKHGILLIGQLMKESEASPLVDLVAQLNAMQERGKQGSRSSELVEKFRVLLHDDPDIPAFTARAKEKAASFIRGFNADELSKVVSDLEKAAAEHDGDGNCKDDDCNFSEFMRAIASVVKDAAKLQLQ